MDAHENPNPYEATQASESSVVAEENSLRAWGFWATLGWSLLIGLGWLVTQIVIVILFLVATIFRDGGRGHSMETLFTKNAGLLLWLSTIFAGAVSVLLCVLVAWLRKYPPLAYLGVQRVQIKYLVLGIFCQLIFVALADGLTWLLGKPVVPDFMISAYKTAGSLPLLWLAVIVAAPVSEEVFFRGFLFRGLAESQMRPWGAILFTSFFWALIHLQYDLFGVAQIFLAGILLGWMRWKSGAITLTIVMHALQNLVATIETAIHMSQVQ